WCGPGSTSTSTGVRPRSCPSTHRPAGAGQEETCNGTDALLLPASARPALQATSPAPTASTTRSPATQVPRIRSTARSSAWLGGSNTTVNGSSTATSAGDRDGASLGEEASREASRERRKASRGGRK